MDFIGALLGGVVLLLFLFVVIPWLFMTFPVIGTLLCLGALFVPIFILFRMIGL